MKKNSPTDSLFETALLIRRTEETLLDLFGEGKLFGTVHTCIGQEFSGVCITRHLTEKDWIFSNHRCHGHFISYTDNVEGLIAEIMGKVTGVCGGWGGSQHLNQDRFFSNGVQGGIVPVAAGMALREQILGSDNIAVVFLGEGTLGEGVVYETANIASKWNLPVLFVLENNHYSQSTAQSETIAGDIQARFAAFGIKVFASDTWHPDDLLKVSGESVEFVRKQKAPAFLHVETYRLKAHSKSDDDRDPKEIASFLDKDLLEQFRRNGGGEYEAMIEKVNQRIRGAVDNALAAEYTHSSTFEDKDVCTPVKWAPGEIGHNKRLGEALRDFLTESMKNNPDIFVLGEDIKSPYGGAFKVTEGLSDKYPERVRNTPISEAAIVGLGNGYALAGGRPLCEIMFGDFLTLAADQIINHASKFIQMYNGHVKLPLIVRTPMGGRRGYGPTHSQSIEKHFLGLPQTLMVALHDMIDPALVYRYLLTELERPTIVIENKLLYARRLTTKVPEGFVVEYSDGDFPFTRIRPQATPDLTIACYGGMVPIVRNVVERLFMEADIAAEVIIPTLLYPMNIAPYLESIADSRRLLVIEEGIGFSGWGSEIVAQVSEKHSEKLLFVRRLASPAHPIPSSGPYEQRVLPGEDTIMESVLEIFANE